MTCAASHLLIAAGAVIPFSLAIICIFNAAISAPYYEAKVTMTSEPETDPLPQPALARLSWPTIRVLLKVYNDKTGITFYHCYVMILLERDPVIDKKRSRCRKKFLRNFPGGFYGEKYVSWERDYKWNAHLDWHDKLNRKEFERLLEAGSFSEIAQRAVKIETRTNLLFSFEKMALRDGIRSEEGARHFAEGLYRYLYAGNSVEESFEFFKRSLSELPRKQTRVLTWPVLTVFPFIAAPEKHIYLKPRVTRQAADNYGFNFEYNSKPNWNTYRSLLNFAEEVRIDIADLKPRDMIDIQSFIWVQGSEEYA